MTWSVEEKVLCGVLVLILAGITAVITVGIMSAEDAWTGQGTVVSKSYDDPDTVSKVSPVVGGTPGQVVISSDYEPARWLITIRDDAGETHRLSIDPSNWEGCREGARWAETRCVR